MANNVKQGWKTTVLGVIIILAAIASVFFVPGITWWPEATIAICIGTVLMFVPDKLIDWISSFLTVRTGIKTEKEEKKDNE